MSTDFRVRPPAPLTPELSQQADAYAKSARAASTRRAYEGDWHHFASWCAGRGPLALPAAPETVALYLADCAKSYSVATLARRLVAIKQQHIAKGFEPPTNTERVRRVFAGIRRSLGVAPLPKSPLLAEDIRRMTDTLPEGIKGVRDKLLLLLGFAGGFRRGELVALDMRDVAERPEGLYITIRRSKTDQEAKGRAVGVPFAADEKYCAVLAFRAWRKAAGLRSGPLFRPVDRHGNIREGRLSGEAVADVVKEGADAIGLDKELYAGHSLRSGFATSAARAGAAERDIMRQTGHKSQAMVRRYIREGEAFRDNAAARVL